MIPYGVCAKQQRVENVVAPPGEVVARTSSRFSAMSLSRSDANAPQKQRRRLAAPRADLARESTQPNPRNAGSKGERSLLIREHVGEPLQQR